MLDEIPPGQTLMAIVFEASGVVSQGEGEDALPTPSENEEES